MRTTFDRFNNYKVGKKQLDPATLHSEAESRLEQAAIMKKKKNPNDYQQELKVLQLTHQFHSGKTYSKELNVDEFAGGENECFIEFY